MGLVNAVVPLERLEAETVEVRGRFESWQPTDEKAELFAAEDAVTRSRDRLVQSATLCVAELEKALGFEDDTTWWR